MIVRDIVHMIICLRSPSPQRGFDRPCPYSLPSRLTHQHTLVLVGAPADGNPYLSHIESLRVTRASCGEGVSGTGQSAVTARLSAVAAGGPRRVDRLDEALFVESQRV